MFNIDWSISRALYASAICTLASAAHLGAQSISNEDSLVRRIRALDSVVSVRRQTTDSVRRSLVRTLPNVEVTSAALSIRTTLELESRVRAAVALTAKVIDDAQAATLASRVANHVAIIRRDSTPVGFGFMPVISLTPDSTRRWYATMRVNVSVTATPAQIADRLSMFV